jgi:hypothetical protein
MADAEHLALRRRFIDEVLDESPLGRLPLASLIEALHAVERLEGMALAGAATECARRLAEAAGLPLPAFAAPPISWLRGLSDQALAEWLVRRAGELSADIQPQPQPSHEAAFLLLGVAHLLDLDPVIAA